MRWLWLWYRLAATALIRLLAQEPPYAAGVALELGRQVHGRIIHVEEVGRERERKRERAEFMMQRNHRTQAVELHANLFLVLPACLFVPEKNTSTPKSVHDFRWKSTNAGHV